MSIHTLTFTRTLSHPQVQFYIHMDNLTYTDTLKHTEKYTALHPHTHIQTCTHRHPHTKIIRTHVYIYIQNLIHYQIYYKKIVYSRILFKNVRFLIRIFLNNVWAVCTHHKYNIYIHICIQIYTHPPHIHTQKHK